MTQHEMNEEHQSAISALVDGELDTEILKSVLSGFSEDVDASGRWDCYHLIGDSLRSSDLVLPPPSADFVAVTMSTIASIEVQQIGAKTATRLASALLQKDEFPAAANDSFKWKLVAGFASVAAVAAVGWAGLGFGGFGQGSSALLASISDTPGILASAGVGAERGAVSEQASAQSVDTSGQRMLRNAELDRYLAAHNQAVGGAALQTTGNFVRNASFTSTDDGQ